MTEDIKKTALSLYSPPFRYHHGYIWDANNEMVADEAGGEVARIRGWGRISYLKEAEAIQDAVGEMFAQALTEFWEKANDQKST